MNFKQGELYHIYNQGNNRQKIFFNSENYIFFLRKIKENVLPFSDILAWCLMPNHFHLMVYIKQVEISVAPTSSTGGATLSRTPNMVTPNMVTFNKSIGIMLASYTRAINNQEHKTGSLFRESTKAECLTTASHELTPSFFNTKFGTSINIPKPEKEYPQICFNYIHANPVVAGLVKKEEDWEYSSYKDFCGLRYGKLINRDRINEFIVKSERDFKSFSDK